MDLKHILLFYQILWFMLSILKFFYMICGGLNEEGSIGSYFWIFVSQLVHCLAELGGVVWYWESFIFIHIYIYIYMYLTYNSSFKTLNHFNIVEYFSE